MVEASGAAVAYLGIDVGKLSHSACAIDAGGEVVMWQHLFGRSGQRLRPASLNPTGVM